MKLLLADDHALFREGLSMIIQSTVAGSEISTAEDWEGAASIVRRQHVDVALVDLFMPGGKPWDEELSAFLSVNPNLPVCIISSSNNQLHITQAFKLGVKGYIRKTSGQTEVKRALSRLINGDRYIPSSDWSHFTQASETVSFKLTRRQTEILMLIAEGSSNRQIGKLLEITESTVKQHVYSLFKSLGVKSRIEAVRVAKSQGLLLNQ